MCMENGGRLTASLCQYRYTDQQRLRFCRSCLPGGNSHLRRDLCDVILWKAERHNTVAVQFVECRFACSEAAFRRSGPTVPGATQDPQ